MLVVAISDDRTEIIDDVDEIEEVEPNHIRIDEHDGLQANTFVVIPE